MTTNPDYAPFIDLTIHDKSPTDIYDAAIATLQARITDWVPTATNIEVMLMEAFAIEVGETLFTLNRIPGNMIRYLLTLYGVVPDPGSAPSVTVTFTTQDTSGYVVPGNTELALLLANGEYMSFFTDIDLVISTPDTEGTVSATATTYSDIANGISSGTDIEMVDSVTGVVSAVTASIVAGGASPETEAEWTARGVQRLQRLSDTLVIPDHFVQAALEDPSVVRANAIDNWNSEGEGDPGDDPGYIAVVVYGDDAPLSSEDKTALQASLELRSATNLIITVIDPTVTDVDITATIAVESAYTEATVIANVEARLTEYLSPNTWPWTGTVRYNELISIIDQVAGVDYVATLTAPASDIVIDDGATLVRANTLTITVG